MTSNFEVFYYVEILRFCQETVTFNHQQCGLKGGFKKVLVVRASIKVWYNCLFVYYESLKRELKTKPIKECRCDERLQTRVVYYESLKRELKTKTIYGFRCDERLKTKVEESTRLVWTLLCAELEHLKI